MRSRTLALALAALGLSGPVLVGPAAAEESATPRIYRWIDENGIAHYTTDPDRIPRSLRQRYGLPAQPLSREPLDASAPSLAAPEASLAAPEASLEAPEASLAAPEAPPVTPPAPSTPDAWAAQEKGAAPVAPPPAPSGPPPAAPAEPGAAPLVATAAGADRLAQLELRIAELSAAIAADEDALAGFVGDTSQTDVIALGDTPQFREIAQRLPQRLAELDALRAERDALLAETPR